jgi:hypothetical protein
MKMFVVINKWHLELNVSLCVQTIKTRRSTLEIDASNPDLYPPWLPLVKRSENARAYFRFLTHGFPFCDVKISLLGFTQLFMCAFLAIVLTPPSHHP